MGEFTTALAVASVPAIPAIGWVSPFALILLCIAIAPLVPRTAHWWERNRNKLILALLLGAITLAYYGARGFGGPIHDPMLAQFMGRLGLAEPGGGVHAVALPGLGAATGALGNTLMEYIPFIVLLFSLYCISGGVAVLGDLPARPLTNAIILAVGGVLANLVGTTGASMLLIRPLLQTNSERKHVAHTVIFFIFIVSNIGGCLLPIGDPPLFLGYLRGVHFLWTLALWKEWAFAIGLLVGVYFIWDTVAYRREAPSDRLRDKARVQRVRVVGKINFLWLVLVVAAVATLDPGSAVPGTGWRPPLFLREGVELALVGLSFMTTPHGLRHANRFNFHAIAEVACLFIGIFLTMQVPIEILSARGRELGLTEPWQFFWATGALSSCLDNAPTYAVFFQAAASLTTDPGSGILGLPGGQFLREDILAAVSLGAVFMGAMTYIGNGPNFMVKSISEQHGVRMPSFFGYLLYSACILGPVFLAVTALFF